MLVVLHILLIPCWIAAYVLSVPAQDCDLLQLCLDSGICDFDAGLCAGAGDAAGQIWEADLDHGKWPAAEHGSGTASITRWLPVGWHRTGPGSL